jgi:cell division protease FtsH
MKIFDNSIKVKIYEQLVEWGMSEKLGLVAYDSAQPVFMGMEYGNQSRGGYSQETAATIDNEIRRLISEAHERAVKLLKENRSILDNMSRVLVEKETIYTEEVAMLMKGASYQEVIDSMDGKEEAHKANPFANMTTPSKEHLVEEGMDSASVEETAEVKTVGETEPKVTEETSGENNE